MLDAQRKENFRLLICSHGVIDALKIVATKYGEVPLDFQECLDFEQWEKASKDKDFEKMSLTWLKKMGDFEKWSALTTHYHDVADSVREHGPREMARHAYYFHQWVKVFYAAQGELQTTALDTMAIKAKDIEDWRNVLTAATNHKSDRLILLSRQKIAELQGI